MRPVIYIYPHGNRHVGGQVNTHIVPGRVVADPSQWVWREVLPYSGWVRMRGRSLPVCAVGRLVGGLHQANSKTGG